MVFLVLVLVLHTMVLVLVLQVWCCVVKHRLVTLVVIMILKDTATFQVLFIVSLFSAWNISLLWRSTVAFIYLKVKYCLCLLPVVLVLILLFWSWFWSWSCKQRSWSWSCYFGLGLGLKNLVLFTSLVIKSTVSRGVGFVKETKRRRVEILSS